MTGTMNSTTDQHYLNRRPLRACNKPSMMIDEHFGVLQRTSQYKEVHKLRPPPPLSPPQPPPSSQLPPPPPPLPCPHSDPIAVLNNEQATCSNCAATLNSLTYPTSSRDVGVTAGAGAGYCDHHRTGTDLCWSGHQAQLPASGGYFHRHATHHNPRRQHKPICSCNERCEPQRLSGTHQDNRIPLCAHSTVPHCEDRESFTEEFQSAYDISNRLIEEDDSAFPALHDREFRFLHGNIPALRRSGVDTTTIRQHFYPDGGWGWIICGVSFLVHILTSGLQLSFDLLLFYAIQHLHQSGYIEWLGALSWSVSMLATPFVVTFCRKKSTRLMAIIGGLIVPLGVLFTSFATEVSQIVFSYGIVFGLGVAMVRESSSVMMGNYFKRRRQFVEMVAMAGEGVGITLFSVILKEGVGKAGWRLGLQLIAILVSANFFMGMLYRPASLYHPQRRAIQHLKNQRRKVREKKSSATISKGNHLKTFLLDVSSLKSNTVKLILLTSSVAAFGIYAPIFSMSISIAKEGSDVQDLVLLQTFLGLSTTLGVILAGVISRKPLRIGNNILTIQIITQVFITTVAVSMLFLSFIMSYRGLCILSWMYGIGFGGYRYSIKVLTLERVKLKQFTKAWGLIRGAESIPVLIGVPLTSFLNDYSLRYGRAGYYICSAAAAVAAITIFFLSYTETNQQPPFKKLMNGRISTVRCPLRNHRSIVEHFHDVNECRAPDLLHNSCINLSQPLDDPSGFRSVPIGSYPSRRQMHDTGAIISGRYGSLLKMPHDSCLGVTTNVIADRPLRRSHSFIHSALTPKDDGYRWPSIDHCSSLGRGGGVGRGSWNLSLLQQQQHHHHHQQHQQQQQQQQRQQQHRTHPFACTFSPALPYRYSSSRSRSVPEGLSSISQCTCSDTLSRQLSYCPYGSSMGRFDINCPHCRSAACSTIDSNRFYPIRRSQSGTKSKPFQYVEQITTSV